MDSEFQIVRRWGEQCPSLSLVLLPSNAAWACIRGAWLPFLDGYKDLRANVNYRWFFKTVLVGPPLPPVYAELAKSIAGSDGLLAIKDALVNGGVLPDFLMDFGRGFA